MPKSYKELSRKAENLVEKGDEAKRNIASKQAQVSSCASKVVSAQRDLAAASQLDKNGKPKGDIQGAQARLVVAQKQLAYSRQSLSEAKKELAHINSEKQEEIKEINKHNEVSKGNISRLEQLSLHAYNENSLPAIKEMAARFNELEDARIALLKSMGINESPQYVSVESNSTGVGFESVDSNFSELTQGNQASGSGFGSNSEGHIALGSGGYVSHNPNDFAKMPYNYAFKGYSDHNQNGYANIYEQSAEQIIQSNLSNSEKIRALKNLRQYLIDHRDEFEGEGSGQSKVKRKEISTSRRTEMGLSYVDNIVDVYCENLYDRGLPLSKMDEVKALLKMHYKKEMYKDVDGKSNTLYDDPNYDEILTKYGVDESNVEQHKELNEYFKSHKYDPHDDVKKYKDDPTYLKLHKAAYPECYQIADTEFSLEEKRQWIQKIVPNCTDNKAKRIVEACEDYSFDGYISIHKDKDCQLQKTRDILEVFDSHNVKPYNGIIYRGLSFKDERDVISHIKNMKWKEPSITSFTTDESKAESFSKSTYPDGWGLILICNNNKTAIPFKHLSCNSQEEEVLSPGSHRNNGWNLRYIKRDPDKKNIYCKITEL